MYVPIMVKLVFALRLGVCCGLQARLTKSGKGRSDFSCIWSIHAVLRRGHLPPH